jgi:flavin reductase (DIM6/NTAB) family NADH-FMN oxidoreductase RutF
MTATGSQPIHERDFRSAIGCFTTGVAVVTTTDEDGVPQGMTVNSLTSVSLRPTLLLVCLARPSRTETAVQQRGAFVINILGDDQGRISDSFARRSKDVLADPALCGVSSEGLPIIKRAMSRFTCTTEHLYPGGDHTIVVGRVQKAEAQPRNPLIFFRGHYRALSDFERDTALEWYW